MSTKGPAVLDTEGDKRSWVQSARSWVQDASQLAVFVGLAAACAIFSFLSPTFLTQKNLINVVRIMSIDGMLAVGMTFVILLAGIDLSVGAVLALTGAVAVIVIPHVGVVAGVLIALAAGTGWGMMNGLAITALSIQPFIATLASMVIARGLTFVVTGGYPLPLDNETFAIIGAGSLGPVPFPIIIFGAVILLSYLALNWTVLGPQTYAIGGNAEAPRRFGVNTSRVKIISYSISGLLAALGGVILTSRLSAATPTAGSGYELDAVAAAVIGGVSLMGGRGHIMGTVGGVAIIAVLNNGLVLLNVDFNYQLILKGLIILAAVSIDSFLHKDRR